MPTYLLSVHHGDDFAFSEGVDPESVFAAVDGFNQDLDRAGALRYAGGLQPASTARTVMADGTVRPGPRIAGEEYLGGFWVIEVADDDAALEWARRAAATRCSPTVEVRPFQVD